MNVQGAGKLETAVVDQEAVVEKLNGVHASPYIRL